MFISVFSLCIWWFLPCEILECYADKCFDLFSVAYEHVPHSKIVKIFCIGFLLCFYSFFFWVTFGPFGVYLGVNCEGWILHYFFFMWWWLSCFNVLSNSSSSQHVLNLHRYLVLSLDSLVCSIDLSVHLMLQLL